MICAHAQRVSAPPHRCWSDGDGDTSSAELRIVGVASPGDAPVPSVRGRTAAHSAGAVPASAPLGDEEDYGAYNTVRNNSNTSKNITRKHFTRRLYCFRISTRKQ